MERCRTTPLLLLVSGLLAVPVLAGCKGSHSHEKGEGEHEGGKARDAKDELPGQSVTIWTSKTELFMEHKPLIAGQEVGFAAHLTEMPSFKAVTQGAVTLTLEMSNGTSLKARADSASSPGIFRPTLVPTVPGRCRMTMTIEGSQLRDELVVGPCEVYVDAKQAITALGPEEEVAGRITFLKEQQWKTDFATAAAAERDLQAGVSANGEIRPVAGKEARLSAASAGRVVVSEPAPILGMTVKKGQVLATIAPRLGAGSDRASLDADVLSARAELEAAEAQLARSERLYAEQAVPLRSVEEARTRVSVARARVSGTSGRLRQYSATAAGTGGAGPGAFRVRSPIDGSLVKVEVASGQTVEEGQLLFTVIDLERAWLVAQVFEPDIPKVEGARTAWFTIEGYSQPFAVDESNGKLVTIGRVLDPQTRTIPVIFEIANKDGRLRIGQFAKVSIATGAAQRALAVPEAALLDEGGKPVTYVMVEGEAFERRPLALGIRSNGWAQVLEGVKAGERVVTKGGYEIKLASASGAIPAHGHAH